MILPPIVSLEEYWWIWESGDLKVIPKTFPIESVTVTIRDPQQRWESLVMEFDSGKVPNSIHWDRYFPDGPLAPSGEYPVEAVACDTHDLCGRDTGLILIPIGLTSTPTASASPTVTSAPSSTSTPIPATPTYTLIQFTPEPSPQPARPIAPIPFWQLIGLLGLFLVIASASVVDPRPAALDRLGESFNRMKERGQDGSFDEHE
jgi:hypothetical protein